MIKVNNLTKIYKDKFTNNTALNNVSFTLGDNGLVFIVGKSGSGKSTLINMLGALDDVTSGEIIIDGVDITKLSLNELDLYRSQELGIIYQNYNLFENDTVLDNIKVSCEMSDKEVTKEEIYSLLDSLDLSKKKDTIVKNLSGGQKQRVAIARALIKNPKIILADEPTGNLDSKTTEIIFNYLKDISKDKLVIVISHDVKSSLKYADRILEISDGEIYSDKIKNKSVNNKDSKLIYLYNEDLEDLQIENINKELSKTNLRVKKKDPSYIDFDDTTIKTTNEVMKLTKEKKRFKKSIKTAKTFFRNTIGSFIFVVILSIFLLSVLSLSFSFFNFDSEKAINDLNDKYPQTGIVFNKGYSYTNNITNVTKDSVIKINNLDRETLESVYESNYFEIYTSKLSFNPQSYDLEIGKIVNKDKLVTIYMNEGMGTIIANEDDLKTIYGDEAKIIAGSLEQCKDSLKLIITDYMADCLIYFNKGFISQDKNDKYQNLLKTFKDSTLYNKYDIGAIVYTGYEEKYKVILDAYKVMSSNSSRASEINKEIVSSDIYVSFLDDIMSRLCLATSINENYIEDYKNQLTKSYLKNIYIYMHDDYNDPIINLNNNTAYITLDETLNDDELILNTTIYTLCENKVKEEQSEGLVIDTEIKIILSYFGYDQNVTDTPLITDEFSVTSETLGTNELCKVSLNTFKKYVDEEIIPYAFLVTSPTETSDLYTEFKNIFFYTSSPSYESFYKILDITNVFAPIFMILVVGITFVIIFTILFHNLRVIKKEQYRIGVYKSLGYSNNSLFLSIFINSLITFFIICVLSIVFTIGITAFGDALLRFGFAKLMGNDRYNIISLIHFDINYILIFNGIILLSTLISSFLPLNRIRRIKPNQILRTAE